MDVGLKNSICTFLQKWLGAAVAADCTSFMSIACPRVMEDVILGKLCPAETADYTIDFSRPDLAALLPGILMSAVRLAS